MDLKDNVYVLKVGEKSSVLLNITVVNWEEAAYETRVYIQTPDKMDYQGVTGEGQVYMIKSAFIFSLYSRIQLNVLRNINLLLEISIWFRYFQIWAIIFNVSDC